ncbi:hypothetical protein BGC07_16790 [Piscirickettsia litoralis]|uniref:DUF6531 domain-containing protein n=2 Tax=Piscirickettsia litoralis TaxID=1891921 RepID=A0ABX3A1Z5_9GAMM|nr:hypothetical protein BGC07_16790 [Piscirickettsia litoralis]
MKKLYKYLLISTLSVHASIALSFPDKVYVWSKDGEAFNWYLDESALLNTIHSEGPISNLLEVNSSKSTEDKLVLTTPERAYNFQGKKNSEYYEYAGKSYNTEGELINYIIRTSSGLKSIKPTSDWKLRKIYPMSSEVALEREYSEEYDDYSTNITIEKYITFDCETEDNLYTGRYTVTDQNGTCTNTSSLDVNAKIKSTNRCETQTYNGPCICNNTKKVVFIAKSFPDGTPTVHAGWLQLQKGECSSFDNTSEYFAMTFDGMKSWSSPNGNLGAVNLIPFYSGNQACISDFITGNADDFYSKGCASWWKTYGEDTFIWDNNSSYEKGIVVKFSPVKSGETVLLTDSDAKEFFSDQKKDLGTSCNLVADPVNLGTGNLYKHQVDYSVQSPYPITIDRYYNSQIGVRAAPVFGLGWTGIFSVYLTISNNHAYFFDKDGRALVFEKSGSRWISSQGLPDQLLKTKTGYSLVKSNGESYIFNNKGLLQKTINRAGFIHTFDRSVDNQITISDDFNHKVTALIHYNYIEKIILPNKKVIFYDYDDGHGMTTNLVNITFPNGRKIYYSYGVLTNTNSLSSEKNSGQKLVTDWSFNSDGRVTANTDYQ